MRQNDTPTSQEHDNEHGNQPPRPSRAWLWPLGVVGALCISLTVCGITVVAATGDPSYAIEDDYYQRGGDWDRRKAQLAASEALGWSAEFDMDLSTKSLSVTLTDALGRPLEGAAVRATVFHHARRGQAEEVLLQPFAAGQYAADIAKPREGQWQIRLRVQRGPDMFFLTEDLYALGTPIARSGTP
ncbi:MAG: FixH family protein [Phycisphaerales bacterium]